MGHLMYGMKNEQEKAHMSMPLFFFTFLNFVPISHPILYVLSRKNKPVFYMPGPDLSNGIIH